MKDFLHNISIFQKPFNIPTCGLLNNIHFQSWLNNKPCVDIVGAVPEHMDCAEMLKIN